MSGPESLAHGIRHLGQSQASGANSLGGHPVVKTAHDKKLWKASLQFEALFMQQLFSSMHKSVPKSGFLPSGFAEDVHNSMMDQAVAKAASQTASMGIAPSIYRQLQQVSQAQVQPVPSDTKDDPSGVGRGEHHGAD
jgi:Rod binding domain-containing protein